jgi:hypothetical protein
VLDSAEEERNKLLHDGRRADAVGEAGKLLEAIGLKPPVASQADRFFAVEERTAQVVAVLAALPGKL